MEKIVVEHKSKKKIENPVKRSQDKKSSDKKKSLDKKSSVPKETLDRKKILEVPLKKSVLKVPLKKSALKVSLKKSALKVPEETVKKKYILFKCGPTGSGKSKIELLVDEYLNNKEEIYGPLFSDVSTVNLSIDDLVNKNPYFKDNIDKYFLVRFKELEKKLKKQMDTSDKKVNSSSRKVKMKSINKKIDEKIKEIIIKEFNNPSQDTVDFFNRIYENARQKTNCLNGNIPKILTRQSSKLIKDTCENIRDYLLKEALDNDKNIVFERTCKDFPTKILEKFPKIKKEYEIIFSWSVVNIDELLFRNKQRTVLQLIDYFKEEKNSPIIYNKIDDFIKGDILTLPRLPDVNKIKYIKKLNEIIKTFNKIYYEKKNRLLVFDNNFVNISLIYDSKYNEVTKKGNPMERYNID